MDFQTIKFEMKEGWALLTLNRPDKLNALNRTLFEELDNSISLIENSGDIHALVITGEGKAFAAGADIKELNACDEEAGKLFSKFGSDIFVRLENLNIPVIAAVNGFALGGGCELAMACHIRFASEKAKFGQPEVNLGIIPGYGATQRMTRLVGRAKAIELTISANMVRADEAKAIGLVNEVFPPEELMAKTEEFVNLVLSKGKTAVANSIRAIKASEKLGYHEGLEYESELFGQTCGTDDFKEGTSAFLEKREAKFK
jgi:enoyl-CoA hydratase